MAGNEFSIIRRYFSAIGVPNKGVLLGIGDDCALVRAESLPLAISIDTLVEGVHFPVSMAPENVGYRALAVSISDLAAMAAKPAWFTLAMTLPEPDEVWLQGFSSGLGELARELCIPLIGGDTTRGPLTLSVQVAGHTPAQPLLRSGAQPGDRILVSGCLGDAAAGLELVTGGCAPLNGLNENHRKYLLQRFNRPQPRCDLVDWLSVNASAGIDISDGLLADLGHILDASGVGAEIWATNVPLSSAMRLAPRNWAIEKALTGGDDYELCVCVRPAVWESLCQATSDWTQIGEITAEPGLRVRDVDGRLLSFRRQGYQHF